MDRFINANFEIIDNYIQSPTITKKDKITVHNKMVRYTRYNKTLKVFICLICYKTKWEKSYFYLRALFACLKCVNIIHPFFF